MPDPKASPSSGPSRVLVIAAHPDLRLSRVNQALMAAAATSMA